MESEADRLLRTATKIASNERSTGRIHVVIEGKQEYLLDVPHGRVIEVGVGDELASEAEVSLTYASEDVFLGLAHKRMDPRVAMITGKISFRGDMALGIKLGYWIRKAVKRGAAEAAGSDVRSEITEIKSEITDFDREEIMREIARIKEDAKVETAEETKDKMKLELAEVSMEEFNLEIAGLVQEEVNLEISKVKLEISEVANSENEDAAKSAKDKHVVAMSAKDEDDVAKSEHDHDEAVESDNVEDTHDCAVCQQSFGVRGRDIHCLFCGQAVCHDCNGSNPGEPTICGVCLVGADVDAAGADSHEAVDQSAPALNAQTRNNAVQEAQEAVETAPVSDAQDNSSNVDEEGWEVVAQATAQAAVEATAQDSDAQGGNVSALRQEGAGAAREIAHDVFEDVTPDSDAGVGNAAVVEERVAALEKAQAAVEDTSCSSEAGTGHAAVQGEEEGVTVREIEGRLVQMKEEGGVIREKIQSRLVLLEEEIDNLEKRAFAARARVLRQLVLMVYRLISLGLVAIVLLCAHLSANLLSRQVGPTIFEVGIGPAPLWAVARSTRSRLAAVLKGATGIAGRGLGRTAKADAAVAAGGPEEECEVIFCCFCRKKTDASGGGRGGGAETGESWWRRRLRRNTSAPSEAGAMSREGSKSGRWFHVSVSVYWTVMLLVVAFLTEHHRRGLILRRIKTFCLAGTAILILRMTRRLTQGMSRKESDDSWADTHKLLAPYVHQSILDVQGMWVKTGQYLSSRADVMPQPYIEELSKLQDALPASPFEEVEKTFREQVGQPLTEVFEDIGREPLASASVAQVHRCTLKDGREAVVKIQHRLVRQLFLEDLKNLSRLVRVVAWAEKDYDFRPIMDEWASESCKELDFECEGANMRRIAEAMSHSGLDVIIPELIPEFTRTKVLVMSFCEGFKVTDAKALAAADLDREGVMRAVTKSFAYQIHIEGLFNGDPHPGNILLQPNPSTSSSGGTDGERSRSATPVLLDWGLAKTLPEHLRIAFSRFIYAGCEHDFTSMLVAFEEMGVKLNRFNPAEDMRSIRFLLRDTQSASESKRDTIRFRRRMAKRNRGLKNPVDAYPGDLLFFLRVHALLRGLATRLNVRQKYMDVMAPFAKQALRDIVPVAERATQAIYPSPLLSPLEAKVRRALEGLIAKGQITGCQVCVIYRGENLVDLCAGNQGPIDPRPVRPSTLFNVFSAGKAVCATTIHLLADRGLLSYDQRLVELWPEFARHGKEATTIRHVLTHTTGLQHAFPENATFDTVCDWGEIKHVLEEAKPAWPPGSRASYHYYTFGWLVAVVAEKASGVPFRKFVREEIAVPLGLEDSLFMGGLSACGVEPSRIAQVEQTFNMSDRSAVGPGQEEQKESAAAGESTQQATMSGSSGGRGCGRSSSRPTAAATNWSAAEDVDQDMDEEAVPRLGRLAAMAAAVMEADPEEGTAIDDLARKLAGREYFLDPRVFNYPQMKEACIPAANGHLTAKALTTLYDNMLASLGLSGNHRRGEGVEGQQPQHGPSRDPLLRRARVNEMRAYQVKESSSLHRLFGLPARDVRWSLGYQMFGFRETPQQQPQLELEAAMGGGGGSGGGRALNRGLVRLSGFGHVGLGGSLGLCDPASGLAFAMVLNKVVGGRDASLAVLCLVCEELGIGEPSHFFEE